MAFTNPDFSPKIYREFGFEFLRPIACHMALGAGGKPQSAGVGGPANSEFLLRGAADHFGSQFPTRSVGTVKC